MKSICGNTVDMCSSTRLAESVAHNGKRGCCGSVQGLMDSVICYL